MKRAVTESGTAVKGLLYFVFLLTLGVITISYIFGYVVPPGSLGVRQRTFGPGQGFDVTGLPPGYHWSIPFYSKVHFVPQNVQVFELHNEPGEENSRALSVKTPDGAYVEVDVSILARYYDKPSTDENDKHGGPADLIKKLGADSSRWQKHILTVASDRLNRSLSELHAAEFYNPHARETAITRAEKEMREILREYGIKIDAVLLRRYVYSDSRIDTAIFNKNMQNQEEKYNEQSGKLAEARAKLEQVSAELDAKIETMKVGGDNTVRILRSEAELYEKEKRATGDLEYAKAQAEVDRLRAGALANASGELYVAREMAPLLSSVKGGVVSETDPYDLDAWIRKLGIGRGGQ